MKNVKKYPKKQLEKYSVIFTQLSLVLVLFIVYQIMEHETTQKQLVLSSVQFDDINVYDFAEPQQDFKKEVIKKSVSKLKKQVVDLTKIEKVKNNEDIPLKIIDVPVIDDEKNKIEEALNNYVEIPDENLPDENVPYVLIEDAPIYKGCEGLSKEENKKCFIKSIQKFVIKRFDVDLAQNLGLRPGKYRMFAEFIIAKDGYITEIKIKAPHYRLEKEVNSIIKKIPKFTPGMQRKVPVNVKFTLPISFNVE